MLHSDSEILKQKTIEIAANTASDNENLFFANAVSTKNHCELYYYLNTIANVSHLRDNRKASDVIKHAKKFNNQLIVDFLSRHKGIL